MRALDVEEIEAMQAAMAPDNCLCPHCGAPTTDDGRALTSRLVPAIYRLGARRLVRFVRCTKRWAMHFDATTLGRMVYRIATGVEVV